VVSVTIDGVLIGNRIYWTPTQLVTTNNYDSLTELHIPNISVTTAKTKFSQSSLPLLGSGFQRRTFPFLWVSEMFPCLSYQLVTSHNCNYQLSLNYSKSESDLLHNWRFTADKFVSAPNHKRIRATDIFQLNPWGNSPYVTSSLTRTWVCLLWIGLHFRQVDLSHT
jgi:hypothetical protein